ncbi:putative enzyme related to lactoylglutathione lyase [Rhodococcus sp. 27YEA15]|uniref:VOC family protein n=1 Tax=Rhodococcus sp. 27YEA15 TaxID=3156259 RepID=UPI003C7A0639
MSLIVGMITVDSLDPGPLAIWWAAQLGGTIIEENDGWFYIVEVAGGVNWAFQKVPDPTPGKNRIHVDLTTEDLDAEVSRLIAAGAREHRSENMGDFRWVTLVDPDGNQFCVSGAHN